MKNKFKYLIGFLLMTSFLVNFGLNEMQMSYASYPEYPTETTVTAKKFVPRIGENITFDIDNYQFENTSTGVKVENYIRIYLPTNYLSIPSQTLKEAKFPKNIAEKYKDGNWVNHGYSGTVNIWRNAGTHIKAKSFLPGEEEAFDLTNEELLKGVDMFNLSHNKNYVLDDMNFLHFFFGTMEENGSEVKFGSYNRLTQEGPMEFTFEILDKPGVKVQEYATLQGNVAYVPGNSSEIVETKFPINWLYYETSDISIEVVDPKEDYNPGEVVKLKVSINNRSQNINNKRLISGLDFGNKEIVVNPVTTEGTPDIKFSVPEDIGSNGMITKSLAPGETTSFETEITLPDDFKNYLNDSGDSIVLTPYLYTSNIFRDDNGQVVQSHSEEREYNEGIELKIAQNKKDITLIGGTGTLTKKVEQQLVDFNQNRISGNDRYETAVEVSKQYGQSNKIVLASGLTYTDELTATVLANKLDVPILLTRTNEIPEVVKKELDRLGVKEVVLIGGTGTITSKVETELDKKYGKENITRIGGSTRFETAVLIGEKIRNIAGEDTKAIVVDGMNFPDAISMTSMAAEKNMPILLTPTNTLNKSTANALKDWGIKNVTIGGGTGSVSASVETTIKKQVGTVDRIAGKNRYETSKLVAEIMYPTFDHAVVSSGEIYADAIVAAPFAVKNGYPLVLSMANQVPEVVMNYLTK